MSNYQKYYDEEEKQLKDIVSAQVAQRRQGDDTAKTQYAQGIDTAAQTASAQYRQRIDQAPTLFQEQYDANHINELVGRKKVQEGMANMGLTDSGLNRSQQTALAVQRGNADAAARRQQQDYVTAAQAAIDKIMAEAETKKQQYGASLDQATNNWATDAALSASQTAATNATARVNAETEAETERIKAQYDALEKADGSRNKYIADLMRDGLTYTQAVVRANAVYPTGNEEIDNYATSFMSALDSGYSEDYADAYATAASKGEDTVAAIQERAKNEIARAGIDTGKLANFHSASGFDWVTTEAQDINFAISASSVQSQQNWDKGVRKIYEQALKNTKDVSLSAYAKEYAVAEAVGKALAKVQQAYGNMNDEQIAKKGFISKTAAANAMRTAVELIFTTEDMVNVVCKAAGIVEDTEYTQQ